MQPAEVAPPPLRLRLHGEAATAALAAWIARRLEAGWRLYLSGDLGAGKTRFTRGLLASLGHHGRVRSPTFTLAEPYNLQSFELYHFDFYRFSAEHEWQDAGFDEILSDGAITSVVEWPEMAGDSLPPADLRLRLAFGDPAAGADDAPAAGDHVRAPADAQPAAADDLPCLAVDEASASDDDAPVDGDRIADCRADTERGRACLSALLTAVADGRLAGVSFEPAQD